MNSRWRARRRVGGVGEREVAHDRQPGALVGARRGGDVRVQLRAQLRVAAPDGQHVGVPHLRAAGAIVAEAVAVGLRAHHAAHRAELEPARVQLVAGARAGDRVEAADVRALVGDARQARVHRLVQRRAEAVGAAPVLVGVAAPDQPRVRLHAVEARADEHREVAAALGRVGGGGAVVEHRVAVVHLQPALAVVEDGVGGRVLAEVLHPAVVAVADGLVEQPAEQVAPAGVGEVHLRDDLVGRERVCKEVGVALWVLHQQALAGGVVVDRLVVRADVRVEVGGDLVAQAVVARGVAALARSKPRWMPQGR